MADLDIRSVIIAIYEPATVAPAKGKTLLTNVGDRSPAGGRARFEAEHHPKTYSPSGNFCLIFEPMEYPSKLVEVAVNEIAKLPGIGKKTALRLVLHLLREEEQETDALASALQKLRKEITYCSTCHMITDQSDCTCEGPHRDTSVVCVVESTTDIMAINNTAQYTGYFHVLGGVISPIEGIGPDDIHIDSLLQRLQPEHSTIKEVILALSPTMEGDTTAFYIAKKLQELPVKVSTISRGIPIGGELEYVDELTLGRSIATRIDYKTDN